MKPIQKNDLADQGHRIQLVLPQLLRATTLDTVLGAGMSALMALLEEERTELCGPRYAHDAERRATRAGYAKSELATGARRVSKLRGYKGMPKLLAALRTHDAALGITIDDQVRAA